MLFFQLTDFTGFHMWHSGIDEAGRGPCIGPLIVGIVSIPASDIYLLEEKGIDDSKKMTYHERLDAYNWFQTQSKTRGWFITTLEAKPAQIDDWMATRSLNELEVEMFSHLANKLPSNTLADNGGTLFLDACDVDEKRFGDNIASRMVDWPWSDWNIVSEHGADAKYRIVGAASIIAKHERDAAIDALKIDANLDFGSGYPSDPKTIASLPNLVSGNQPNEILRWKWKTTLNAWMEQHPEKIPVRQNVEPLFPKKSLFDF